MRLNIQNNATPRVEILRLSRSRIFHKYLSNQQSMNYKHLPIIAKSVPMNGTSNYQKSQEQYTLDMYLVWYGIVKQ